MTVHYYSLSVRRTLWKLTFVECQLSNFAAFIHSISSSRYIDKHCGKVCADIAKVIVLFVAHLLCFILFSQCNKCRLIRLIIWVMNPLSLLRYRVYMLSGGRGSCVGCDARKKNSTHQSHGWLWRRLIEHWTLNNRHRLHYYTMTLNLFFVILYFIVWCVIT